LEASTTESPPALTLDVAAGRPVNTGQVDPFGPVQSEAVLQVASP
jgi:hypothetical protein